MEQISRRDAVRMLGTAGAAVAVAGTVAGGVVAAPWVSGIAHASAPAAAAATMTPDQALARLVAGNRRFVQSKARNPRQGTVRRAEVAQGQAPFASIVSCSDSRVPIEVVFDQGLGDLFGVRDAGNTVSTDPVAFGSAQYGCLELNTPLLMVLGHTNCGAIAAAVKVVTEHAELPGHLPELVESIEPAVITAHGKHPSDLVAATIEENVRLNVKRLIDDTPILSDALAAKKIAISGGVYDIATGKVGLI